jgi:Holliday junction resolvasome RuvABC ATP-dependent DNA helicase subunit
MHEGLSDLATQLRLTIKDYAGIAVEYAKHSNRTERIAAALLQASVDHLLDQECGVPESQIRDWLAQDMTLNAQGLDFWLSTA